MKKNKKFHHAGRMVSLLLALCMILCMVPTAFAGVTDTQITSVTATTGLTYPPVIGQPAGDTTQATVPAGANYTCEVYWWESPDVPDAPTVFEADKKYVMTLTFKANDGFTFSKDCTATVDGKAAKQTVLYNNDTEIAFILP